ncbi:hypothetical protein JXL19_08805 [bacterium]|nr:hypothetical protein [bacterium]
MTGCTNRHKRGLGKGYGVISTFFLISLLIGIPSSRLSAKTVWRIGENDGSSSEFGLPGGTGHDPNINQEVVCFTPPQDPNAFDWQSFPCRIWPQEVSYNPKEIRISFDYPGDLRSPVLRVKAKSSVTNFTQELILIKGGVALSEDLMLPAFFPAPDATTEIPLGYIRKGAHEEDTLILKNKSLTDNDSILFDYLELDDQDQDGDGSLDYEEIEGDIDGDGIENASDPDTATLLIQGRDSTKDKQITLDILEKDGEWPYFTWLAPLDANSPEIITGTPGGFFFPYGVFRAHIYVPIDMATLTFSLYVSGDQEIYDVAQFYIYIYEEYAWSALPLEIISKQAIRLSIGLNGDMINKEGEYAGELIITGGLAYPEGLGIDLENAGLCFIKILED